MIKKNGGLFGRNPTFNNVTVEGVLSTSSGAINSGASLIADMDGMLTANSDARVATQKAVKSYVDGLVVGLLDFKGLIDCSGSPNYPAASKGDSYLVSVTGKIGGASGNNVFVGDLIVASADNTGGTQASVGSSWFVLERNLDNPLLAANNLSDLANAATARTNLGLGSVATQASSNVAITGGSISGITDLAIADGGTGASTQQAAINALAGAVTAARFLRGDGTNVSMSAIQASDVPTLNQSTTGSANSVKSNATTGLLQVAGPAAGATRVMTTPDANFSAARTDAAQTFTGAQTFGNLKLDTNTISSTNTNGEVNVTPNGTGYLKINHTPAVAGIQNNIVISNVYPDNAGGNFNRISWQNSFYGTEVAIEAGKINSGSNASQLSFWTNESATLRERARFTPSGHLDMSLAYSGNVLMKSGNGIDFSATGQAAGMTSELLNDYEEGTCTVTLTPGTGSITLATNTLNYTKIGRQVTVVGRINASAISAPSGTLTLAGLPFNVNASIIGAVSIYASGMASAADGNVMADSWLGANTVINFSINANQITASTYLRFALTYFI